MGFAQAWALPDAATKNPHNVLKNVHCRDKTVKNADLSSARTLLPLDFYYILIINNIHTVSRK